MKAEPTKGEWSLRLGEWPNGTIYGFGIYIDGKVPPIASAGISVPNHVYISEDSPTAFTSREAIANARLMAASKELLEACRELIKEYRESHRDGERNLRQEKILERAVDAIAKAEGGKP